MKINAESVGIAGFGQKLFSQFRVVWRADDFLVVTAHEGSRKLRGGGGPSVHNFLDDLLFVDAEHQRLANLQLGRRKVGSVHAHHQENDAHAGAADHVDIGGLLHQIDILDRHIRSQVDLPGDETRQTGRVVAEGLESGFGNFRGPLPAFGEGLQMNVAVPDPFFHPIRPRSHGMFSNKGIALSGAEIFGHDKDRLVEGINQDRPRGMGDDVYRMRVDLFDFLNFLGDEFVTVDGRFAKLKSEYHIVGRKGGSVLPFYAFAQMKSPCRGIQKLPGGRQAGDDLAGGVTVHQPVKNIIRNTLFRLHGNC